MLQRDIQTEMFLNIRRRKVELHSRGFSLNKLGSNSIWRPETASSTKPQKCSTPEDKLSRKDQSPSKKHFQRKPWRRSKNNTDGNNELHSESRSSISH